MKREKLTETADKYLAEGKHDKAIKAYEKVVEAEPSDMRLRLKLGDLYVKRKKISKAIKTYLYVADSYVKERFHLKAIAIFKMILKLNPTMVVINERLGDLYREVGLKKDAISQYFIVAEHYEQTRETKKLLEVRRKIVEADPSAITSRIRLAEVYQKEGRTEDSLHEYELAAEYLRKRKDKEALVEVYEKILYYRPNQLEVVVTLCHIYLEKDAVQKAQQCLEAVSPEFRKKPEIMEVAVEVYLRLEQREKVRHLIRDLYQYYAQQGDRERGVVLHARAKEEFRDDHEYLLELEKIYQEAGFDQPLPRKAPGEEGPPKEIQTGDLKPYPRKKGLHEKVRDEDLEKTVMVHVDEKPPQKEESGIDLNKTVMVHADESPKDKPSHEGPLETPTPQEKKPEKEPKERAKLNETVLVSAEEIEKQFKKKKD